MQNLRAAHNILYLIPLYIGFMIFTRGFYHPASFAVLGLTFFLFSYLFYKDKFKQETKKALEIETALFNICLFSEVIAIFFVKGMYQDNDVYLLFNYLLILISIILTITFNMTWSIGKLIKWRFPLLIFLNLLIRLFLLAGSPDPVIDVFDSLKNGPLILMEGNNPYDSTYSQVYSNKPALTYFPYPPGSLIILTPFVFLLKDPRILFAITETLIAVMFYLFLKRKGLGKTSELIPVIYLFSPFSFFILEQSWLDPLASFLIVLLAFVQSFFPTKILVQAIILGFTMAIKQYLVIIPIFFLRDWHKHWKVTLFGSLFFLLILLPFFLMDPAKFNVYRLNYAFRYDGLTLPSFLYQTFQYKLTKPLIVFAWVSITLTILSKKRLQSFEIYLGMAYWFLGFFSFSFIAFINEYSLAYTVLLLAYVVSFDEKRFPKPKAA